MIPNDIRMLRYVQGRTDEEIAGEVKRHPTTIASWRKKNNLAKNSPERSPENRERARLYDLGMNDAEIGQARGVTKEAILYWRRGRGLPPQERKPKARTTPTARELDIVARVAAGERQEDVGRSYGISRQRVSTLLKRVRQMLPGPEAPEAAA